MCIRDRNKHQKASGKAVFESLVPEIMNANFEDVQLIGKRNLVNIKGSNIPLPSYVYDSAKGRIDFTYRGLPSELCTVTLTDEMCIRDSVYPAGWIPEAPYDPADDWGENWMDNWDI